LNNEVEWNIDPHFGVEWWEALKEDGDERQVEPTILEIDCSIS
jgi:hypothetical protein